MCILPKSKRRTIKNGFPKAPHEHTVSQKTCFLIEIRYNLQCFMRDSQARPCLFSGTIINVWKITCLPYVRYKSNYMKGDIYLNEELFIITETSLLFLSIPYILVPS